MLRLSPSCNSLDRRDVREVGRDVALPLEGARGNVEGPEEGDCLVGRDVVVDRQRQLREEGEQRGGVRLARGLVPFPRSG